MEKIEFLFETVNKSSKFIIIERQTVSENVPIVQIGVKLFNRDNLIFQKYTSFYNNESYTDDLRKEAIKFLLNVLHNEITMYYEISSSVKNEFNWQP